MEAPGDLVVGRIKRGRTSFPINVIAEERSEDGEDVLIQNRTEVRLLLNEEEMGEGGPDFRKRRETGGRGESMPDHVVEGGGLRRTEGKEPHRSRRRSGAAGEGAGGSDGGSIRWPRGGAGRARSARRRGNPRNADGREKVERSRLRKSKGGRHRNLEIKMKEEGLLALLQEVVLQVATRRSDALIPTGPPAPSDPEVSSGASLRSGGRGRAAEVADVEKL